MLARCASRPSSRRFPSCVGGGGRAAAGRAHEHELQGRLRRDGPLVVRMSGKDTGLLAIDRENEAHNTSLRAETGVGAPFVACGARAGRAGARVPRGRGDEPGEAPPRRPARPRRGGVPPPARRAPFLGDFDMFEIQRALSRRRAGARLPPARPLPRVRAAGRAHRGGDARARRSRPCPCNNDLLAENFIDVGGELRMIDYEYSGQQRAVLRARERLERVGSLARPARASSSRTTTAPRSANKVARCRLWGLMSKYGWMLWALDPGRGLRARLRLLGVGRWRSTTRAVAEFDGPDFERLLADVQRGRGRLAAPSRSLGCRNRGRVGISPSGACRCAGFVRWTRP